VSELDPSPPSDGRSAGAAVAPILEAAGVEVIFGIPGVHNVELYRGLQATGIRHILGRHEQGVGFMADGYARLSGRPGVCFVISGPGLTNIATPMGQAFSDSIPMLVVGAVRSTAELGGRARGLHEIGNQHQVAEPLSNYCATAMQGAQLPGLLTDALASLQGQRARPAFVEVPLDVMVEPFAAAAAIAADPSRPAPPLPDSRAITAAARLLEGAERPVLIAGGGAIDASAALRLLVEQHHVAVIPTIAGKGIVSDRHRLSAGSTLPQAATLAWLSQADVVLAVGTELAPTDTWQPDFPIRDKLIRIDIDAELLAGEYAATVSIRADARLAVEALLRALSSGPDTRARGVRLAKELAGLRAQVAADASADSQVHRKVLEVVRNQLPADGAVFTDMTRLAYSGNEIFPVEQPRSWFHPVGFGTLGYAVPAAIGGKVACPEKAVIAIVGDYGFGYTSQELMVASELGLPVPVVLWNSENLGAIEEDMRRKNIPPTAVEALNPDFGKLADAYHCDYAKPSSLSEFGSALAASLGARRPTIIELTPAIASS
jgi:5-guanidino-2-oxopentanoate decarboxylase